MLTGVLLMLSPLGNNVDGAAWSEAMRGNTLLVLAAGGVVSFAGEMGLTAGAAPTMG